MDNNLKPEFLLFAQHGWADTSKAIARLAGAAADSSTLICTPSLGLIKTFIRIEPLVMRLEQIAAEIINNHPNAPIKIVGHSMGGLIWLEVLNRNRQWWQQVHSLILLGSPVGGSNVARIIDPLGIGIGTARDLGKNRRPIAETIARHIPTLSVASDLSHGSDGLVAVENTKFDYANLLHISNIHHDAMRYHPDIVPIIQNFWANPQLGLPPADNFSSKIIQRLRTVPGMTDTSYRNFRRSQIIATLAEQLTLHTWKNALGINHVYLGKNIAQDRDQDLNISKDQAEYLICGQVLYAGYVGLIHNSQLRQAIREISLYAV